MGFWDCAELAVTLLTGSGAANYGDFPIVSFAVNVNVGKGEVKGSFTFTTPAGTFVGSVTAVECRRDGGGGPGVPVFVPNIANFEGTGQFNGVAGYDFAATLHDHGEGKSSNQLPDELAATAADSSTVVSHGAGLLTSGNIQLRAVRP